MALNDKYSFRDLTGQTFLGVDPSEFNDSEIVGSCFYQESARDPDSPGAGAKDPSVNVFPPGMTGVTFTRCNLDNCKIPLGNTVGERNSHRKIRVQNDNRDWILADADDKPLEPTDKKLRIREGKSVDPKNIPSTRIEVA